MTRQTRMTTHLERHETLDLQGTVNQFSSDLSQGQYQAHQGTCAGAQLLCAGDRPLSEQYAMTEIMSTMCAMLSLIFQPTKPNLATNGPGYADRGWK